MATIKEVAAAAGVSLGTASNVINGKTNNIVLIEKVEEAIRRLDYRPDAKARSLKISQTFLIGVIIDSLKDSSTQQFLASLERQLSSRGYSIVLRTSGNNAILEGKNAEYFIQLGVDGIIVCTNLRKKKWLKKLNGQNLPILIINRSEDFDYKMDIIHISHKKSLQKFFIWCKENNYKKTGFIFEMASVSVNELEKAARENNAEIVYKIVGDYSSESGFKAAYELLYENPDVDNIVIGSSVLARGVQKVLEVKGLKDNPALICVTPENWIDNDGVYEGIIEISDYNIGCIASKRLLERIDHGDNHQNKTVTVYSDYKENRAPLSGNRKTIENCEKTINIALLEAETTKVLKMLSDSYEKNNGIKIKYHFFNYYDLWKLIINPEELSRMDIDIIMYDILWKDNLIEDGYLKDISYLLRDFPQYFKEYINNITDNICLQEGRLYGLPFLTGTQLLLYQKDLFEDNSYKIQFRRKYGRELSAPKTWEEYNLVAEFFTKACNEKSPVSYGTALINEGNLYNSIDFLNRLWTFQENNHDSIEENIANDNIKLALENYKKAFHYSNQTENYSVWEDVAAAFKKGDVAMVVLYDSFAFGINDAMFSKVAGNVGSTMIPGGNPVLGGWGLGMPNNEKNIKNAVMDYLMWSCGPQTAEPFSILAGTSSRKFFYDNKEATGLYPWKDQILNSYSKSRRRKSIKMNGILVNNIILYDEMIGKKLGQFIRGEITADEVIKVLDPLR